LTPIYSEVTNENPEITTNSQPEMQVKITDGMVDFILTLPSAATYDLRIYNILGREVSSVCNQWEDAGTHTMHFNALHLTSGLYFARVSGFSTVQKFVVVK